MATLTVGPGKQYRTIDAAVDAANAAPGADTIQVSAGTYTNDFITPSSDMTLTAVGGMVRMNATTPPPNGKAIATVNGTVTFNGFEFSGADVADNNGAGIRFETGNLTINDCYFHHNEMGILTNNSGTGSITIDDSEFAFNGRSSSGVTGHALYVGKIDSLTVTDSYFHDTNRGHSIKSRAESSTITNNRIQDEGGTGSYNIDIPNGGNVLIQGNVIEQGPNTENANIIAYGTEPQSGLYASSSLRINDNTIINDKASTASLGVFNNSAITAQFTNNDVWGLPATQIARGPVTQSGTTFLGARPTLDESHPFGGTVSPPPPPPSNVINGTSGNDILSGTSGNDTVNGFAGQDIMYGNLGNDTLVGDLGIDTLVGGPGNDTLVGGLGGDILSGGTGLDSLLLNIAPGPLNVDRIYDFNSIEDTILLSASIYGAAGPQGTTLAPAAFFTGSAAHDTSDRLLYNSGTGALRYDPDGTGAAPATQIASLMPGLALTSADFKIV